MSSASFSGVKCLRWLEGKRCNTLESITGLFFSKQDHSKPSRKRKEDRRCEKCATGNSLMQISPPPSHTLIRVRRRPPQKKNALLPFDPLVYLMQFVTGSFSDYISQKSNRAIPQDSWQNCFHVANSTL